MIVLQIEHKIQSFDSWKEVFDSDPIHREKSGVRSYRIYRPADNSNYVIIDLEFDNLKESENVLVALQKLWTKVDGKIMVNPQTRILDIIERKEY